MANKKRLYIKKYMYDDTIFIKVYDDKKKKRFTFLYDEEITDYRYMFKQKRANEEVIRKYYQSLDKEEKYIKTKNEEFEKDIKKVRRKKPVVLSPVKNFKNTNRIVFRKIRNVDSFQFTYISVRVKIYFDGHYVIASGRSRYIYTRQIRDNEIGMLIQEATLRAIAPYGSNLKFKLLSWNYAYYQASNIDFKLRKR